MVNKKLLLAWLAVVAASSVQAGEKPHWGYAGQQGPAHWGELDPAFNVCAIGRNQSPIDLQGFVDADLPPVKFNYRTRVSDLFNDGHTVDAQYEAGSKITVDGIDFEIKQFHFHTPSENHISGQSYPMEAHLVHADAKGNLAVVAVLFTEGKAHDAIAGLWKQLPQGAGQKQVVAATISALDLLPQDRDYYRYNGSLTTPPCTEGVRWIVLKNPLTVSKEQVEAFERVIPHPNNRPVQPHNARFVLQ